MEYKKQNLKVNTSEEWRSVVGYEGLYEISSEGRVKRLYREIHRLDGSVYIVEELIMTPSKDKEGYLTTKLRKDGGRKTLKVHRLVAIAFLENPKNHPEVNHIDRRVDNNSLNNLEWCSSEYNQIHDDRAKRLGVKRRKKVKQYTKDKVFVREWGSLTEIKDEAGYSMGAISLAIKGQRISHGYLWEFK